MTILDPLNLTPEAILEAGIEDLAALSEQGILIYHPTVDEMNALKIGHRYESVKYLLSVFNDDFTLTINVVNLSNSLNIEAFEKVPMLSHETALARLAWAVRISYFQQEQKGERQR